MIYKLTLQENFSGEYKFKNQIKGSSGSVMGNIAEGVGREVIIKKLMLLPLKLEHL